MNHQKISIATLRLDGGTQPREQLNEAVVAEFADLMREEFWDWQRTYDPIVVFYDGSDYWLAHGFHRTCAAQQAGIEQVAADLRQGTLKDAQWFSYSVNQQKAQGRTNAEKRRAVEAALRHEYASRYSLRQIAQHCGVSKSTVENYRNSLSVQIGQIDTGERLATRNGTTYPINTANIGKRARRAQVAHASTPPPPPSPSPEPAAQSTRAGARTLGGTRCA